MIRISKLSDYAIMVMVALGEQPGQIMNAQGLSEETHLELPTVSKVLKLLARADLVSSFRGANGGYCVDRAPQDISVAEIISAIEGPIAMTECMVEAGLCSQEEVCRLRSNWQKISTAVARAIESVSLADMSLPPQATRPASDSSLNIATVNRY